MRIAKYAVVVIALVVSAANVFAQTADEIIQKHIDAIGGEAAWAGIKTIKMVGNMSVQGMEIGMTSTVAQDKGVRMDMTIMGSTGYTIITPTEGWMYMPAQGITTPTPLPADQVKGGKTQMNIRAMFMADKALIAKSEYLGKESINNILCHKLKITETDSTSATVYMDAGNYNFVRIEAKSKGPDGSDVLETMNYSNFTRLPEGVTVAMTWGTAQGDINYKTVEINKPVDDNTFKPTK